jgi:hypothetical protein
VVENIHFMGYSQFQNLNYSSTISRRQMWTAAKVEAPLAELEEQASRMLDEAESDDAAASSLAENSKPLSPELANPARRREKLLNIRDFIAGSSAVVKLFAELQKQNASVSKKSKPPDI